MRVTVLVSVSLAAALLAPSALAAPAGQVRSVSVDPGTVVHAGDVRSSVEVTNPGERRSQALTVLLKLRAPDGDSGVLLTSLRVGSLAPHASRTLDLTTAIPPGAPAGDSTVVACRAKRGSGDACGISRQQAPLRVLTAANLAIAPSPHGFGTHATGTTSPARTFTVTNTGESPAGAITTSLTGADPGQFTKSADNCNGQVLAPGASCTVDGAFAPAALGAKSAGLQATAGPGGSATATVSGTGADPASLTISPTSNGFGNQVNGTTSGATGFTVTNTGGVPSGTIATSIGGADPGQFTTSADTCNGVTLVAGGTCTLNGAFAPTSSGAKSASLQASASPGGTASSSLTGTGQTPAHLTISPTSWDFGNVLQGTLSSVKQFTVTNTGEQTATIYAIGSSGPFQHAGGGTCLGAPLGGGQTCVIDVRFNASGFTGSITGSITVYAIEGASSASASLSGTAVTTAANLQIGITSFGSGPPTGTYSNSDTNTFDVQAGQSSSLKIWIRNTGAADAYVSSPVPVSTTNATLTVFETGTNMSTCNVASAPDPAPSITFTDLKIPGGGECYIAVRRRVTAVGAYSVSFSIVGNPGGTITGTINGSGT
jgi:hypothetical protein